MSSTTTKIAELVPNCKGERPLVFEVTKILERSNNNETALCRIVDETGVITAEFNQFVQYIIQGSVYQLTNFRCKVVNHHLRLEMTKTSVMAKLPQALGFKDLENDLSAKFYVANQVQEPEKNGKKEEGKETNAGKKVEEGKKRHQTEEKPKKQEKNEKKAEYKEKKETPKEETKKQEEPQKKYVQKKPEADKPPKKYEEKVPAQSDTKQSKKAKYVAKTKQIRLIDMPKHQQESMSFLVRVNLATSVKKQKYFLCKVSDSSGSTYFQFQPKMGSHLQNKAWYKLTDFKIFADKEYGFIATQEAKSGYELIENVEEQVETKLLWR